ncbi:Lrp/AsnC family transcriptional regulator [Saccharibacillus qingshengii]|uniref:Lrp/AsnC family transcriptional regulator n=1 Tax=Saccharibacillus qingshengii TaxID=1763540 RepID=UPI00155428C5|nr:Lrp/AsnC family transcriptional regulator [Saccharibacillus qingshengii]
MQLDHTDYQILRLLTENSRIQWKELGEQIHMTGQAVGNRIKKLEDGGIIRSYSLIVDELKLGLAYTAFVVLTMNTADHKSFVTFITERNEVIEAHRISGEGCYHLTLKVRSQEQLNDFLNALLAHGNYGLNLSIQTVKQSGALAAAQEE